MPTSVRDQKVRDAFDRAGSSLVKRVAVDGHPVDIAAPFPSPIDWRDQWIYFVMIDRFNNRQRLQH